MAASGKKSWMPTVTGVFMIIAAIHFWLLGILAIIFVALSRKEFA
jgi:hypothetical protein